MRVLTFADVRVKFKIENIFDDRFLLNDIVQVLQTLLMENEYI